jgi:hypothetical protein
VARSQRRTFEGMELQLSRLFKFRITPAQSDGESLEKIGTWIVQHYAV